MEPISMTAAFLISQLLGTGLQAAGANASAKSQLQQQERAMVLQEWMNKQQVANQKANLDLSRLGMMQSGQQFQQNYGLQKQQLSLAKNAQQFSQTQARPGMLAQFAALGRRA